MNASLRWMLILVPAGAALLSSCAGSKAPACFPVKGRVSYKGKPLAEAMVVLHRVGGDVEGNQEPMAFTDASGAFSLTTFKSHDGAPPGDYLISIEQRALQTVGEETIRNGPNVLPPKYANPETSGLKYTVVEADNSIPQINVD